jgi:hypothetical protein
MNSFNVYGYRLKSTDIVVMKDITDFKDIRHQTGLSNTWWFKTYNILFTPFNLSPVLALIICNMQVIRWPPNPLPKFFKISVFASFKKESSYGPIVTTRPFSLAYPANNLVCIRRINRTTFHMSVTWKFDKVIF